jgi:hypothetical protein
MTRRRTLAAAAALALSALPACGDNAATDARAEIETTLNGFMRAVAQGDGSAACARLAPAAREQFTREFAWTGAGCDEAAELTASMMSDDEAEAADDLRVRRVRLDGERASVDDRDVVVPDALTPERNGRPTVFRRARGAWLIEDLG